MNNMNIENQIESLRESINWEWVQSHHGVEDGEITEGPWASKILAHAVRNGYKGELGMDEVLEVLNEGIY